MIQKTILAVLLLLLSFNLSAQNRGKLCITELDLNKVNLPENIEVITSLDDLDSNVYIIRNGKESLKDIAEKLYLSTINGLPAYVYLKALNKITDEHQLLREGTVIKLSSNAVMPTQKQIKLALLQPFKNVHIVKEPTENLYTICKQYGLKSKKYNGNFYDYNLYLQSWNNIEFSDNFLAIGRAVLLTENTKMPTQEQINQLFATKKQRVWVSAKLSELKN